MSGGESAAPASSRLGSISLSVWQYGRNAALSAAEYVTPVLKESQFAAKGVLTPEEFVEAGDMLVLRCPTWQWQAGDPSKARPFLPPDKQFLLTRNVPCQKRACTLGDGADDEKLLEAQGEDSDDEGWVATHTAHAAKVVADDDAPDMDAPPQPPPPAPPAGAEAAAAQLGNMSIGGAAGSASSATAAAVEAGLEECDELEEYDPSALDMGAATSGGSSSAVVRTRTYDASMSYDKYYQCARVWLYGYSEDRQPLTQGQILEDISTDHALKTVTLEAHPHIATGAGLHASIHPCKHAAVMKKLCDELAASGKECRPEQYLFIFLKFISAVCPTIEYDYTLEVDGR